MKPSTLDVLNQLRTGPKTTHDLGETCGYRYGARILELRDLGYVIGTDRLPAPTSGSRYTLISEPGVERSVPPHQTKPTAASGMAANHSETASLNTDGLFDQHGRNPGGAYGTAA